MSGCAPIHTGSYNYGAGDGDRGIFCIYIHGQTAFFRKKYGRREKRKPGENDRAVSGVPFHGTCHFLLLYEKSGICTAGTYLAGTGNAGGGVDSVPVLSLLPYGTEATGKGKHGNTGDGGVCMLPGFLHGNCSSNGHDGNFCPAFWRVSEKRKICGKDGGRVCTGNPVRYSVCSTEGIKIMVEEKTKEK